MNILELLGKCNWTAFYLHMCLYFWPGHHGRSHCLGVGGCSRISSISSCTHSQESHSAALPEKEAPLVNCAPRSMVIIIAIGLLFYISKWSRLFLGFEPGKIGTLCVLCLVEIDWSTCLPEHIWKRYFRVFQAKLKCLTKIFV